VPRKLQIHPEALGVPDLARVVRHQHDGATGFATCQRFAQIGPVAVTVASRGQIIDPGEVEALDSADRNSLVAQ
jgi:hypothetical protein